MANSRVVGIGTIPNYRLECAKHLNIIEDTEHAVKGVIWDIDYDQLAHLDLREGYPDYYTRTFIECTLDDGQLLDCIVYIMTPLYRNFNQGLVPDKYYLDMVRQGYDFFKIKLPKLLTCDSMNAII